MSSELALSFDCQGDALVGVLSLPESPAEIGVVVVVGGPQYRGGSHRQFVLLARAIAGRGHAVLRFDVRGMGDSAGAHRSFEHVTPDIGAAIDTLQVRVPAVRKVVLWGLCDGASAALLYLDETHDTRVGGVCLLNPWVRSAQSLARVHVRHYYVRRLAERAFWTKLLSGGIGTEALRGLMANLRARRAAPPSAAVPYQSRMARGWKSFEGNILLVLSGDDLTAREFADALRDDPTWTQALQRAGLQRHDLADADHTFTTAVSRSGVEGITNTWLAELQLAERPAMAEGG